MMISGIPMDIIIRQPSESSRKRKVFEGWVTVRMEDRLMRKEVMLKTYK